MQKRTLKVAILAVLAIILVLSFAGVALADQTWSDLPDTVTAKYGITDNQVAAISEGFPGGLWKPYQSVTRAQFTKMAVAAFKYPLGESGHRVLHGRSQRQLLLSIHRRRQGRRYGQRHLGDHLQPQRPTSPASRPSPSSPVTSPRLNGYDLATMYTAG